MNGATTRSRTYLSRSHHFPTTLSDLQTRQTHRVVVDASRRDLEGSVEPDREDRLTRSDDRVEVISGESERQDISYRDLRR